MRKGIRKPINYTSIEGVMQEEKENPAVFQGWLVEAFRKYTDTNNTDPPTPERQFLLAQLRNQQEPPEPCPACKQTGLWKRDCPWSGRGRGRGLPFARCCTIKAAWETSVSIK